MKIEVGKIYKRGDGLLKCVALGSSKYHTYQLISESGEEAKGELRVIGDGIEQEMIEIVVWIDSTYTKCQSIWVPQGSSDYEISKEVDAKFKYWYSYDIHPL